MIVPNSGYWAAAELTFQSTHFVLSVPTYCLIDTQYNNVSKNKNKIDYIKDKDRVEVSPNVIYGDLIVKWMQAKVLCFTHRF